MNIHFEKIETINKRGKNGDVYVNVYSNIGTLTFRQIIEGLQSYITFDTGKDFGAVSVRSHDMDTVLEAGYNAIYKTTFSQEVCRFKEEIKDALIDWGKEVIKVAR